MPFIKEASNQPRLIARLSIDQGIIPDGIQRRDSFGSPRVEIRKFGIYQVERC